MPDTTKFLSVIIITINKVVIYVVRDLTWWLGGSLLCLGLSSWSVAGPVLRSYAIQFVLRSQHTGQICRIYLSVPGCRRRSAVAECLQRNRVVDNGVAM